MSNRSAKTPISQRNTNSLIIYDPENNKNINNLEELKNLKATKFKVSKN